jgi:magnesium-dependent phosphatase 1
MAENKIINSNSNNSKNELIKLWQNMNKNPKCIVFDLDYTLWPFILDSNVLPPFRYDSSKNTILDYQNKKINLYQDVDEIVRQLGSFELHLAIASRSTMKEYAIQLLDMFDLTNYFQSIQIYSGPKLKHMQNIRADLNRQQLSYNEILFFDDNKSNLELTENRLGVIGHQVRRHYGLNYKELFDGLKKFNNKA